MKATELIRSVQSTLRKHSPEILTGLGIAGMIATTIMAVQATPKAMRLIEEAGYQKGSDEAPCMDMEYTPLTTVEMVKAAWTAYIPAVITGIISISCLIGANSVNMRRNAALATAYTISEKALRDYKDKTLELVGDKKEKEIRDAVAKDIVNKQPVETKEIYISDKGGSTLCIDAMSGRYFMSDRETLKRIENELNERMLEDGSVCLNDLYDLIGGTMEPIYPIGDDLGWDTRTGLIKFQFSSQLATNGTPCLVLGYSVAPKYDYYR